MTIKLLLLKSGEDMIANVSEMTIGEDENRRVVGYYLNRPCVIKMKNPDILPALQEGNTKKAGYEVSLFPWIPLSAEENIPIPSDWVVTMVDPAFKLKEMYVEDIVKYERVIKDNKGNSTDEQSDSDKSD
jgi:hypothetical protein